MERIQRFPGTLAPCPGCGGQPKHVHRLGGDKHYLECCPCGTRTAPFSSLNEAVEAWERTETRQQGVAA